MKWMIEAATLAPLASAPVMDPRAKGRNHLFPILPARRRRTETLPNCAPVSRIPPRRINNPAEDARVPDSLRRGRVSLFGLFDRLASVGCCFPLARFRAEENPSASVERWRESERERESK